MYQRKIPVSLECGLNLFREVTNGKWKIHLIYYIYTGIKRPGELQRKIPDATRRVLDNQLNQLIKHNLITKQVFDEVSLKVEYNLTPLGESLIPVIVEIVLWGEDNRVALEAVILEKSA
ncbi:MAG: helix-turn-helix domain-containing protein [Flavipsychrobacter sp.]|nr:helix-turn-helix domain-containing protein [Flavipsychrobacter sp.]